MKLAARCAWFSATHARIRVRHLGHMSPAEQTLHVKHESCEARLARLIFSGVGEPGTMSERATIVRVKIEQGKAGLFYATSPDLRGLLVGRPDLEALFEAIPQAIADLYAARGIEVVVTIAKDDDPEFFPWVAIPTAVARNLVAH